MRDFLDWLYEGQHPGHLAELRVLGNGGHRTQRFYRLGGQLGDLMVDAIIEDATGNEAYIGVNPRWREGGTAADTYAYTKTLFFDVDQKDHGDDKRRALDAILAFDVQPSVIVDSGHGFHCYVRLDRFHLFDVVQPIMRGIAQRIGGDRVYDRARILRLPGLSNHKGGGCTPVRLIRFDTTLTYNLADLAEYAWRERKVERQWRQVPADGWGVGHSTDADRYVDHLDFDYDPGKGMRSEHDYGVVCQLIEHGWSDPRIVRAFEDHPQGIGAKFSKAGYRYLERTIRKAHQAVGR